MLADRILLTLKFFDEQQTPLTLLELQNFLFNEPEVLRRGLDSQYELRGPVSSPSPVSTPEILRCIINELPDQVVQEQEWFCLPGRQYLIIQRLNNDQFRLQREKIIRRCLPWLKLIPFVRGVAVGGSQTLSANKPESDIDLLIVLDPKFLWLGRLLVTAYFQLTGQRRHGSQIRNRFCLNHYLAGPIEVTQERDPYNAMEYLRLRPEVYGQTIVEFLENNWPWMRQFFPQAQMPQLREQKQSKLQKFFEIILGSTWLNHSLGHWQMRRISRGVPAVANQIELSFHSKERKFEFLSKIFGS